MIPYALFPPQDHGSASWTFAWIKLGLIQHIIVHSLGHFLLMFRISILHCQECHIQIVTSNPFLVNSVLLFPTSYLHGHRPGLPQGSRTFLYYA